MYRVCVEAQLPANVAMMLDCYGNSCPSNRETMHVQGLSHWAPANIGPYSQCTKVILNHHFCPSVPFVIIMLLL